MRKITVRLDDADGEAFAAFCGGHGVTMSALLTGIIDAIVRLEQLPSDEQPQVYREEIAGAIQVARDIDAMKRRRS